MFPTTCIGSFPTPYILVGSFCIFDSNLRLQIVPRSITLGPAPESISMVIAVLVILAVMAMEDSFGLRVTRSNRFFFALYLFGQFDTMCPLFPQIVHFLSRQYRMMWFAPHM